MKKTVAIVVCIFLISFLLMVPVKARDAAETIKNLDRDGDGKISSKEFKKSRKIFNEIDTDGDGFLTQDEFLERFRRKDSGERTGLSKNKETSGETTASRNKGGIKTIEGLYFVDAHSQMDEKVDEERVISLMDHAGIYRTLLASHMKRDWREVVSFSDKFPERILPAVRIKGAGYQEGKAGRFTSRFSEQMAESKFRSIGEVLIWHDSGGGKWHEIRTDFEDRQVRQIFKTARKKGWPFIIHIEFASLSDSDKSEYMEKLETFLKKNPDHAFVMIHMAQLEAGPVRRLLKTHGNLYFMTSSASPAYQGGPKPFINMFKDGRFAPAWQKLLIDFSERFVFAMDNVFSPSWVPETYLNKMGLWWRALAELPDQVAHAIAHGNAERLWKIEPKPHNISMNPPWVTKDSMGPVLGKAAGRRKRR